MPGQKKLFLTMFQAEMEDSHGDVLYLSGVNESRFKNGEITNYVYNENKAFLAHEASGIKELITYIGTINAENYKDVEEMASSVGELLKTRAKEQDDPQAVYGIISRKIKKVMKYIMEYAE
ncbi:MAG: hypothetical protein LBB78_03615 [Spirochaetaceae bacterium]|jgi:O-phosphoseryl-tRNA(Cys) synthetase|nr:hypothetical protein [Spirochaetaceae bacterium]